MYILYFYIYNIRTHTKANIYSLITGLNNNVHVKQPCLRSFLRDTTVLNLLQDLSRGNEPGPGLFLISSSRCLSCQQTSAFFPTKGRQYH